MRREDALVDITEKTEMLYMLLGMPINPETDEQLIQIYLDAARREILSWRGIRGDDVPEEYEMTQIYAVIAGYSQSGAEGQTSHTENGIGRTFKHADMISYIRANVVPYVKVVI